MIGHAPIVDPGASVALDFCWSSVAVFTGGFSYSLVRQNGNRGNCPTRHMTLVSPERFRLAPEVAHRMGNSPLVHYTTLAGIHGILSSRTLWATSASQLNDSTELTGAGAVEAVLSECLASSSHPMANRAASEIRARLSGSGFRLRPHVVSFTERRDAISLWRGYCQLPDGFAIGFTPERMHNLPHTTLVQIRYSLGERVELIRELVRQQFEYALANLGRVPNFQAIKETLQMSSGEFASLSVQTKRECFDDEREWRLVLPTEGSDRLWRPGRVSLIDYVPVVVWSESEQPPIEFIDVGPGANRALLETMLDRMKLGELGKFVHDSKVPLVVR